MLLLDFPEKTAEQPRRGRNHRHLPAPARVTARDQGAPWHQPHQHPQGPTRHQQAHLCFASQPDQLSAPAATETYMIGLNTPSLTCKNTHRVLHVTKQTSLLKWSSAWGKWRLAKDLQGLWLCHRYCRHLTHSLQASHTSHSHSALLLHFIHLQTRR